MEQFAISTIAPTASSARGRPVSAQDWENQRLRIQQLYSTENKSLDEVRNVMETVYGFRATNPQYKRRISQWHLDKNVKDGEIRFMEQKQKTRKALENKDTAFRVRGRTVASEKVARGVKRKNLSEDTLISVLSPVAPTPSDISYHTPSATDHPTPRSPFIQPSEGQIPTSIRDLTTYSVPTTPAWNTFTGHGQAPFPNPLGFHEPFPAQIPLLFPNSPVNPHSPSWLPIIPSMAGVLDNIDAPVYTFITETCESKLTQLIELIKQTEETVNNNYMQIMFQINSLVYELVTADAHNFDMHFEGTLEANRMACSVCQILEKIGKSQMAQKVESERLLLEAIAVSEGRFGEDHHYSTHLRLNLLLLYKHWGCRDSDELLVQILKVALQSKSTNTSFHLFVCFLNSIDLTKPNEIAYWCRPQGGECPAWVGSLYRMLGIKSKLPIPNDDEARNIQRGLSKIIQILQSCVEIQDTSKPMLQLILKLGPTLADDPVYFWIAAFFLAVGQHWEPIFSSRHILGKAALHASMPGSIVLKTSIDCLAENPYRLEKSATSSMLDMFSPRNHEEQPEFKDTGKLAGPLRNLDELALVLAEFSLIEIEKGGGFPIVQSNLDLIDLSCLDLLRTAAELGNPNFITQLAKLFKTSGPRHNYRWASILNQERFPFNHFNSTPLRIAIKAGHEHVVSTLIDVGASINGPFGAEQTPIELAYDASHHSIVRLLIKKGARAGCHGMLEVLNSSNWELIDIWIQSVFKSKKWCYIFGAIIHMAREEKHDFSDVLCRQVRDVLGVEKNNIPSKLGLWPPGLSSIKEGFFWLELSLALKKCKDDGNKRGLELLLDALFGPHVEEQARSTLENVLLMLTYEKSGILLEFDLSPGSTFLHNFVRQNAPNALSVFLELGADTAVIERLGNTALHLAASLNYAACALVLLRSGTNVDAVNALGQTALQVASQNGHQAMEMELMNWQAQMYGRITID